MSSKTGISWTRLGAEGVAIVFSILLAFGIQAWWEGTQLRRAEAQFLGDLADEFRVNRERLAFVTERQALRRQGLRTLIREAGPEREGIGQDSLHALLVATAFNPRFDAATEVVDGGGLEVVGDPYLRRRVSGFWSRYNNYFSNQERYVDLRLSPDVVFGTGTAGLVEFDILGTSADSILWSHPVTPDQMNFLKFLAVSEFLSGLGVDQGSQLLAAMDSLVVDLEGVRP